MDDRQTTPPTDLVQPESKNKKNWKFWLRLVVGPLIILTLVYLLRKHLEDLKRLKEVSIWMTLAIAGLYLLSRYAGAITSRIALKMLGHQTGRYEMFMLMMSASYANLLIPRAGLGAPALYLKLKRNIGYTPFFSQMLAITVLQNTLIGFLGLICQLVLWKTQAIPFHPLVAGIFGLCLVVGLAIIFIPLPLSLAGKGEFRQILDRVQSAWRIIHSPGWVIFHLVWINVAVLVLRSVRLQLALMALGQEPSFFGVFIGSCLADLMLILSITPAALGFREVAITYSAAMMGTTQALALSASVLDRLIWTAATIVVGQIAVWQFIGRMKTSPEQPELSA